MLCLVKNVFGNGSNYLVISCQFFLIVWRCSWYLIQNLADSERGSNNQSWLLCMFMPAAAIWLKILHSVPSRAQISHVRSSLCQHARGQTRQRQDWDWELRWPAKLIKMNHGSQTCLFKAMTGVVMMFVLSLSRNYQHINIHLLTWCIVRNYTISIHQEPPKFKSLGACKRWLPSPKSSLAFVVAFSFPQYKGCFLVIFRCSRPR